MVQWTTSYDAAVVLLCSAVLAAVVAANVQLWRQCVSSPRCAAPRDDRSHAAARESARRARRRTSILVRAKSLPIVTTQTAAGVLWFVGFAVRNGVRNMRTHARPSRRAMAALTTRHRQRARGRGRGSDSMWCGRPGHCWHTATCGGSGSR